jgi:hypothetical protein
MRVTASQSRHARTGTVPKLDASIVDVLRSGDQKRANEHEENGAKVSISVERDHGALLQIAGRGRNAPQ